MSALPAPDLDTPARPRPIPVSRSLPLPDSLAQTGEYSIFGFAPVTPPCAPTDARASSREGEMGEDDRPADERDQPSEPAADRPATGYRYFPANPITPGRWDPADLRIRRTSRRSH